MALSAAWSSCRCTCSGPLRTGRFSLDDPAERREVYQIVFGQARQPGDLAAFLNGGILAALWRGMFLSEPVRQAWEDQYAALRAPRRARPAARTAAAAGGWISQPCPSRMPT